MHTRVVKTFRAYISFVICVERLSGRKTRVTFVYTRGRKKNRSPISKYRYNAVRTSFQSRVWLDSSHPSSCDRTAGGVSDENTWRARFRLPTLLLAHVAYARRISHSKITPSLLLENLDQRRVAALSA